MADGGVGRIGIVGELEVGIDISNVDWPGELCIVAGPDPKILVADELLWRLYIRAHREEITRRMATQGQEWRDTMHPDLTLERRAEGHGSRGHGVGDYDCFVQIGHVCHFGSVLRIKTTTQQLVYVVGEYVVGSNAWWCQWPD